MTANENSKSPVNTVVAKKEQLRILKKQRLIHNLLHLNRNQKLLRETDTPFRVLMAAAKIGFGNRQYKLVRIDD